MHGMTELLPETARVTVQMDKFKKMTETGNK